MNWFDEIARWYLVSLAASLCAAPFTAWLFRRLPGHGAWFARPIGLLAVIWPIWFLASITPIPFSTLTLILSALAVAALAWGLAYRQKTISRDWLRPYLAAEGIYLTAFMLFIWFRGYIPKIAATEKPMDTAFLSATIRTTDMPPADPWMAGETINYYYLGYLLNGSVARIAALPSWIAFNLALAGIFAMCITSSAGLAWALLRSQVSQRMAVIGGAAAAFLLMIAGNIRAPVEVLRDRELQWNAFWYQGIGWQSSRVVVDNTSSFTETINEFPSFSFILGDLHPHVLTLPFAITVLALAVSLFKRVHDSDWNPFEWRNWAEFVAVGAILGALYPMNSWDFPTYGVAIAAALLLSTGPSWHWLQQMAGLSIVAILAWSPFWVAFVPFAGTSDGNITSIPGLHFIAKNVATYTGERTSAGEYLTIWGMLLAISIVYLVVETVTTWQPRVVSDEAPAQPPYVRGVVITSLIAGAFIALALPAPVLVLAGIPILLAARLIYLRLDGPRDLSMLVNVLFLAGWTITVLTEFFYINDSFNGRFNTLFKIYYQVWTLIAIAAGLALILLWQRALAANRQIVMGAASIAIVAAGLVYPVVSIKTFFDYLNPTRNWVGLDGLAPHGIAQFVVDPADNSRNSGKSEADVTAIRWLNENGKEGDVLLEAPGCGYTINGELPTSRFSAFTGIPTVIGWDNAESQWRNGQPELDNSIIPRQTDVSSMYGDPNPATNPLFDEFGITLMVVGDLEKYGAGMTGLTPNERPVCGPGGPYDSIFVESYPGTGWELVFDGETKIYRRTDF